MENKISCEYIGHATTLIEIDGTKFLTDPNFARRLFIFKRRSELSLDLEKIANPDVVLLSHVHFDHLNIGSYKYISTNVPVIIPEGCDKVVAGFISNPVIELSPYATHRLLDGTEITAVPVRHRAGRYSHLRFTQTNGYLIKKGDAVVFFCGDSAYGPHFKEIGNLAKINLAILPIGSYSPRWFMRYWTMSPDLALRAFEDLGGGHMVPIHWGTFSLTLEPLGEPRKLLEKAIDERQGRKDKVHILPPGQRVEEAF